MTIRAIRAYVVQVTHLLYNPLLTTWSSSSFSSTSTSSHSSPSSPHPPHPPPLARYDLNPITVRYHEDRPPLYHFLTTVCAIVGGTFTVAGQPHHNPIPSPTSLLCPPHPHPSYPSSFFNEESSYPHPHPSRNSFSTSSSPSFSSSSPLQALSTPVSSLPQKYSRSSSLENSTRLSPRSHKVVG